MWHVIQWDYCMGFWCNVVLILPDRELPSRSRYVSSVRAPISVGIFPTKNNKISMWWLLGQWNFQIFSVQCNTNLTCQLILKEIQILKCCQQPNFRWNIPYKITRLVCGDYSVYAIFYRVLVQGRTNLTCQLIIVQPQECQRCESSDLAGNRACQNSLKWQYS